MPGVRTAVHACARAYAPLCGVRMAINQIYNIIYKRMYNIMAINQINGRILYYIFGTTVTGSLRYERG